MSWRPVSDDQVARYAKRGWLLAREHFPWGDDTPMFQHKTGGTRYFLRGRLVQWETLRAYLQKNWRPASRAGQDYFVAHVHVGKTSDAGGMGAAEYKRLLESGVPKDELNKRVRRRNPRRPLATLIHPVTKRRTHFWRWATYPTRDEARRAANGLERQTGQLTKVRKLPRRRLFAVYATIEQTKAGPYL